MGKKIILFLLKGFIGFCLISCSLFKKLATEQIIIKNDSGSATYIVDVLKDNSVVRIKKGRNYSSYNPHLNEPANYFDYDGKNGKLFHGKMYFVNRFGDTTKYGQYNKGLAYGTFPTLHFFSEKLSSINRYKKGYHIYSKYFNYEDNEIVETKFAKAKRADEYSRLYSAEYDTNYVLKKEMRKIKNREWVTEFWPNGKIKEKYYSSDPGSSSSFKHHEGMAYEYYENGKIKAKGPYTHWGSKKGDWYYYNETGKRTKINHDMPDPIPVIEEIKSTEIIIFEN